MNAEPATQSRRTFLQLTSGFGAGLALARALPARGARAAAFAPNAWVRIAPDESVTVIVSKSEMGQGVATGLPTILADELDASMDHVRFEFAPADPAYVDPVFGDMVTGGSTSVPDSWLPLRHAGATARAMLIAAAAREWNVPASECTTRPGVVWHAASRRSATYGSLAAAAAALPLPANVPLKSPANFSLIGKAHRRLDTPRKVNGSAEYGIDVRIAGMKYAAIARSPVFGGSVARFDARKAKAVRGVTAVLAVPSGVAVIATNTHAAFAGKDALEIEWHSGPVAAVSTASMFAAAERLAKTRSGERVALSRGEPDSVSGRVLEATYRGPFLAHATMEPMNATADVRADRCEVWAPNQVPLRCRAAAAEVTGLPLDKCFVHTTLLGGGFGRRLESDYAREAVEVSKAIGAPVKVM